MARKFTRVPELSLKAFTHGGAKERTDFIDALMEGFQYYGFIILKDHAVSRDLLKRAYELSAAFFALPEAEKRRYIAGVDGQRGYTPFGKEHAKDAKVADLKAMAHPEEAAASQNAMPSSFKPRPSGDSPRKSGWRGAISLPIGSGERSQSSIPTPW